jgi:hypothetical protein
VRSTNVNLITTGEGIVRLYGSPPSIRAGAYFTEQQLPTQLNRTELELDIETSAANASIHIVPNGAGAVYVSAYDNDHVTIDVEWPEDIPIGTSEFGGGGMAVGQSYGRFPDSFALDDQHMVLRPADGFPVIIDGFASTEGLSVVGWKNSGNHPGLNVEDSISPAIMSDWGKSLRLRTRSMNGDLNLLPDDIGQVVIGGTSPTIRPSFESASIATPINSRYPFGMIAHWTFDESHFNDTVGANNGVGVIGAPEFVPGIVGTLALRLDGNTTIRISSTSGDFNTGDYTVSLWLRVRGNREWLEQSGTLHSQQTAFGCWFDDVQFMRVGKYNLMHFSDSSAAITRGSPAAGAPEVDVNGAQGGVHKHQWYHVVSVRRNGGTQELYIDGKMVANNKNNLTVPAGPSGNFLYIGSDDGSSSLFSGDIDDIAVWARPLTASEIHTLYNFRNPSPETLSPYSHQLKHALQLVSFSHALNKIVTGDILIDHPNPTIVSSSPNELTIATEGKDANIIFSPQGSGVVKIGEGTSAPLELFGFDFREYAVIAAKDGESLTIESYQMMTMNLGGTGIVQLVSGAPTIQSTAGAGLGVQAQR